MTRLSLRVVCAIVIAGLVGVAAAVNAAAAATVHPVRPIAHVCSLLTSREVNTTMKHRYAPGTTSGWTTGPNSPIANNNPLHSINKAYVLSDSATCSWSSGRATGLSAQEFWYQLDIYAVPVSERVLQEANLAVAHKAHQAPIAYTHEAGIGTWAGYTYSASNHLSIVRIIVGHDVITLADDAVANPSTHRSRDLQLARKLVRALAASS